MAGDEGNRKLECLAAIATGIIVFSLGFEFGKERLYDNTSETMKPIITALFSELTTLGFIGLMLFVVFQLEWIGDLSENLFEDEEALDGLSETAHMVLFLVMVLFLAQVNHRLALFAATRKTFMVNHPEEITDASCFQFSTYLSTALGTTIAEFVEVPARCWIAVELLLLALVYVFTLMEPNQAFVFGSAWAGSRGRAWRSRRAKIRAILQIHCEAHLDDDDPRSPGGVPSRSVAVLPVLARRRGALRGGALPPLTTTAKMTRIIEDFTVVAHIDTFVNRRFIQQVLRRQKTVAAFAALRVVQSFYDTDRLRATTGAERTTSKADDAAAAGGRCWPCGGGAHSQTEALGLDVARLKRRRHWRTLFKIFDSDGQGSIDLDEIRDLLSKFAHACNVDAVLELLDTDGSGDIGFEEFFAFGLQSEASSHGEAEHDLINKRIFDLIDEDHSGCISIDELHEVFVRLGQHVSMDDVYNIVSDIDEDGDGTLDAEEFSILLNRLHI
ncbi:Ca2-binding protein [Aureococcus anophagefferens]|nr:Ca2-binding protein [Aureococcus anophagefferens]